MFLHQLSDDLVLTLELFAQGGDGAEILALRWAVPALEGRSTTLEELLLPEVEQGRRELMLVAEIGDGHAIDQMAPQDGYLLNRCIVLAGLSHGETPAELYDNSDGASLHFRLKQNTTSRIKLSPASYVNQPSVEHAE